MSTPLSFSSSLIVRFVVVCDFRLNKNNLSRTHTKISSNKYEQFICFRSENSTIRKKRTELCRRQIAGALAIIVHNDGVSVGMVGQSTVRKAENDQ